jgi:nickel superoxide dismutase
MEGRHNMKLSFIKPVYAHCDLPCGVYDPAQALIEAKSLKAILAKYDDFDEHNKIRAVIIKEERAELVKYHLMVLWADYFKPEHLEKYPDLHQKFWLAIKQASNVKHSLEEKEADKLIAQINEISDIFFETKK